ncbi:alkylhydroperoxidase family enzyme [Constrictibacter sp. MBR-5]|jgi:alkylhydroperoxidase family enzyme|uniref:carboxymuconolactone decarboxylase family protein n=1 Tax=Constrictibacter sp. MBR-5 TaxID=3156467 RepID=UPI003394F49F
MRQPEARIPLLGEDDARQLGKDHGVPSSMAPLNVFRAMLNHPVMAASVGSLLANLLYKANKLDGSLRELIIMRIGWRTGAVYEWTQHWRVCMNMNIDPDLVLAVRDWRNASALTEAQMAVLAATDETLEQGRISDATWAECCRHLATQEERIEMVLAISNWRTFSELLQSLRIPLEDGVEAWPPDGKKPPAAG